VFASSSGLACIENEDIENIVFAMFSPYPVVIPVACL